MSISAKEKTKTDTAFPAFFGRRRSYQAVSPHEFCPSSRAGLPPLFFWELCTLALLIGVLASRHLFPGLAGAALLLLLCPSPGGSSAAARRMVLLLCVVAGFFHMRLAEPEAVGEIPSWFIAGEKLEYRGRVVSVAGLPDRRLRILLEEVRPVEGEELAPLPGRVNLSWDQGRVPGTARPLPGQHVLFLSRIRPVSSSVNIDAVEKGNDISAYWAARNVRFNAWATSRPDQPLPVQTEGSPSFSAALRESIRNAFVENLNDPAPVYLVSSTGRQKEVSSFMTQGQAMLPALLFGDRYALNSSTLDLFTKAGLVHSLALSGQHLALALLIAATIAAITSKVRPYSLLFLPRRKMIFLAGLPLSLLYLWLGDAPPSLIRAVVMLFAGALLWLKGKVSVPTDALFLAALCFLIVHPASAFDLSVRLSMLSVAGILFAAPLIRAVPFRLRPLRVPAQLLVVSLAAQTASLPVVLHSFGRFGLCFLLNLPWLPVLGFFVLPLAALGCLLLPVADGSQTLHLLLKVAALPGDLLLALLRRMEESGLLPVMQGLKPTGITMLGFACALAALACASGRSPNSPLCRKLLLCAVLLLPVGLYQRTIEGILAAHEERIMLRVLDVGQGQSLVLEYPTASGTGRMLLDGGGSLSLRFDTGRDIVAHALTFNRPPRLDALLASHADMDHIRGLISITDSFQVPRLYLSALPGAFDKSDGPRLLEAARKKDLDIRPLAGGDVISLSDDLSLEVLHPPARGRFSSNNGSLVLRLVKNGKGLALFCGDAEKSALRKLLKTGLPLQAQVLVLPHHGSASSLLPEFYDAVRPRAALVSNGSYNVSRFPHPDVLNALKERKTAVFSTAEYGELRIVWTKNSDSPSLRFGKPAEEYRSP